MNNPYEILNISESATNLEIENARRRQLKLKCSIDENLKDEKGEYLSDIINKAADSLLDPDERRKIDDELNSKNVPSLTSDSDKQLPSVILTSINDELIKNNNKIIIKKKLFGKKVICKNLFIGILSSGVCIYLVEDYYYKGDNLEKYFHLREYFSKRSVTSVNFKGNQCPWNEAKVFIVDGLLAIAFPAYQVLPNMIINNGKISEDTLRKIFPIVQNSVAKNFQCYQKLFDEEKNKVYKK